MYREGFKGPLKGLKGRLPEKTRKRLERGIKGKFKGLKGLKASFPKTEWL